VEIDPKYMEEVEEVEEVEGLDSPTRQVALVD
jgi:hypothetical protein